MVTGGMNANVILQHQLPSKYYIVLTPRGTFREWTSNKLSQTE